MITRYKTDSLPCKTYKALLTQTGPVTATSITNFIGKFIIGEEYTITNYSSNDDFSNIANVTSGTINTNGCVFTATGHIPNDWTNGSTIDSTGGIVVTELENSLGFTVSWSWVPFGGTGYYIAVNEDGSAQDTFPREKTSVYIQNGYIFNSPSYNYLLAGIGSVVNTDDIIYIDSQDLSNFGTLLDDTLYYTPITIEIYP